MDISTNVRYLKGVGDKRAALLAKLDIFTISDLLNFYPRDYENRGNTIALFDTVLGEYSSVILTVGTAPTYKLIKKGLSVTKFTAFDESGICYITFFNQPYAKNLYQVGSVFRFYGKVDGNFTRREMTNPISEIIKEGKTLDSIVPIYPLTSGLSQNYLRTLIKSCLNVCDIQEILPDKIIDEFGMMSRGKAVKTIHFPENAEILAKAKKRLAFDELLIFRLGLQKLKKRSIKKIGIKIDADIDEFYSMLSFSPTNAQRRAIDEVLSDMRSGNVMTRLIQGDVGSGKTAVAAGAIYACVKSGHQAIMMAPTEILARQHFASMVKLFENSGINICLLVSGLTAKEKREVLNSCESGTANIVIGTHSVIEEKVKFANVGLVIADEQHRFGVMQRALLSEKGCDPHTLIMSATPIPRTLALIVYGDLNVSILDELPPGRKKIQTYVVNESYRKRIYTFVEKLVSEGGQAYIVCPLVEDSDGESNLKDVVNYAKELDEKVFPEITTGFIHGKMKSSQKDEVMTAFANGDIKILISTTVIEVGVNVPNAVIMIVENAERFGLSQLHQLRGRVGRGDKKSYCILISQSENEKTLSRLSVMAKTNDGFEVAKADLEQRGPGDFFGERQHGLKTFKLANILEDAVLIATTQKALEEINQTDPELTGRFAGLLPEVKRLFTIGGSENIFN